MKKLKSISEFKNESISLSINELSSISGGAASCQDEQHGTNWGQSDTEYWTYDDFGHATGWVEYADGTIMDFGF